MRTPEVEVEVEVESTPVEEFVEDVDVVEFSSGSGGALQAKDETVVQRRDEKRSGGRSMTGG